jgi:hypothetical protein
VNAGSEGGADGVEKPGEGGIVRSLGNGESGRVDKAEVSQVVGEEFGRVHVWTS